MHPCLFAKELHASSPLTKDLHALLISILPFFLQVSEWIVHVIISQGSRSGRRSVLNCLLRLAQVSWNIGNLNGVMEILIGLR